MKIPANIPLQPLKRPSEPSDGTKVGVASPSPQNERALKKACQDFEAMLIRQMLSTMRGSANEDTLDGGSVGRTYREMLDSELADRMAEAGGMGIANILYRYLTERGEAAEAPSPTSKTEP